MSTTTIPEGYVPYVRRSPLTDPWEPLFERRSGNITSLALQVREAHCNSRGFAHGGLITALADNAMGISAVLTARANGAGETSGAVTVSITLDFIDSGRVGDWIEFHPTVLKTGRTLAFVECRVKCGQRVIARCSATFRIV
jgi:uncharacterized protein (TIGR00369 family)